MAEEFVHGAVLEHPTGAGGTRAGQAVRAAVRGFWALPAPASDRPGDRRRDHGMTLFTQEYLGGDSALWFLDCLAVVRADAASTGGSYGLTEVWAPRGSGSTTHTHTREDETIFVLDGVLRLWHNGAERDVVPGRLEFLPRGDRHAYEVASSSAHFCVLSTPAGFEEFYRSLGVPAAEAVLPPRDRVEPDAVLPVLAGLGVEVHGPRPGAPQGAPDGGTGDRSNS